MVRDVIWKEMDAEAGAGFRPDELVALFGGWSAGGYGALYNYYWFLDDLLWPRTAAFPDAGGALDNEQQVLIVSNPYDDTQRQDAFFTGPSEPSEEDWRAIWINKMRSDYCDTKDLNGINYYYTSVSDESLHVVKLNKDLWLGSVDATQAFVTLCSLCRHQLAKALEVLIKGFAGIAIDASISVHRHHQDGVQVQELFVVPA
jgi:hypothetical protein